MHCEMFNFIWEAQGVWDVQLQWKLQKSGRGEEAMNPEKTGRPGINGSA